MLGRIESAHRRTGGVGGRGCGSSSPTPRTSCARRSPRSAATPSCTGTVGWPTQDELADAMRRTEQEASRMGRLVDDMLVLAKLDQHRPLERAAGRSRRPRHRRRCRRAGRRARTRHHARRAGREGDRDRRRGPPAPGDRQRRRQRTRPHRKSRADRDPRRSPTTDRSCSRSTTAARVWTLTSQSGSPSASSAPTRRARAIAVAAVSACRSSMPRCPRTAARSTSTARRAGGRRCGSRCRRFRRAVTRCP